jgi:tricarballylate dehydrogenase
MSQRKVLIIGCGSAALCAGIAALEAGADVTILEKAGIEDSGGNSRYTAGAMRFAYSSREEIIALLVGQSDGRLARTDFGTYPKDKFASDMCQFNGNRALSDLQHWLVDDSYSTMLWLMQHNIRFDPIYSRQSLEKDGKAVFWGGLSLESRGEGVGLVDAELKEFRRLSGKILYQADCRELLTSDGNISGIQYQTPTGNKTAYCDAVILASGGFEASRELRGRLMGDNWTQAKVRGTPHNTGAGLIMALDVDAGLCGRADGCHIATARQLRMASL